MSAPSPGTSTRFRLARITGLVLGSLVFLHACERSKSALLGDVGMEVAVAAALGAAALAAGWFEIKLRAQEEDADPSWDDSDRDETPSPGNSSGRSGRYAAADDPERARAGRTRPAERPAPMARRAEDDRPESAESGGSADLVAGIARTLRITRPGAAGARPQLPALSAMTKWMRRVDPDKDTDPDEVDDDEIEQITRTETGELVVESSRRTVRAKIARSGDLDVHGRAQGGPQPRSEWKWTFPPETFPAIRVALGDGPGDLLDLLEDTIPWLDAAARHDPGAWLRAHDIPATYREKGVSATQVTRELPVLRPGRPPQPPRSRRKPTRDASGAGTLDDHGRRERPPAAAQSPEPLSARRESRSTAHAAADPRPSSRRTDADRRARGGKSRGDGRPDRSSDDHGSLTPSRRRLDEPARRFPRTETHDAHPPAGPTPDRPQLPRRRHQDRADDQNHGAGRPDGYDDDRWSRASRQGGRGRDPEAASDFEPRTGRRERSEPAYRDRPAPLDRAAEQPYDQPAPGRRHRGDERQQRGTPHDHTFRRGW
ncbi:hypothetical protein [Nocardia barduliensis]|uniref:hypothetical protein n=1 Tax=Nocardia barduliensis TaxID=2736643 RepID=UPI001574DC3E|nr:hypothetical protein [Nocardia barduliensis]